MSTVKIIAFIAIVILLIYGGIWYNGRLDEKAAAEAAAEQAMVRQEQEKIMASIIREDVVVGTGVEAKNGDTLVVHYVGTLPDGTKFDSSYDRGQPFEFALGAGRVIKGWDLGLLGMRVGGKRNLTIPPELGYGANSVGKIPANATLKFEVELLEIEK